MAWPMRVAVARSGGVVVAVPGRAATMSSVVNCRRPAWGGAASQCCSWLASASSGCGVVKGRVVA